MPSGVRRRRQMRSGEVRKKPRARASRTKSKDIMSNPIIAANWDHNQTLAQNYRRLGITAKLQKPSGGTEAGATTSEIIARSSVKEGRIVRLEDGTVRVEYDEDTAQSDDVNPSSSGIVRELEEYASRAVAKPRHLSERENEWLTDLVRKHGSDFRAMQWDKRLNPFQHSAGELRRRIAKLHS